MSGTVGLSVDGRVAWIVFDNPSRRNAVTGPMLAELATILAGLATDESIRVIGMRGVGEQAFVSGADITAFGSDRGVEAGPRIEDLIAAMRALDKPIVAALRGHCLGAGVLLALGADIRLAGDDLRMGIPAARLGVAYPRVGVAQVVQLAGPAVASEMLMSGRPYDADEAFQHGLVNRVVPAAELLPFAEEFLASVAANAPLTLSASKRTIASVLAPHDEAASERAVAAQSACFGSADFQEGQRAFAEKRTPVFEGR